MGNSDEMTVYFPGGKRVDAQYKGFTIRTDQSVHGGGEGAEPAPFDLFLASIATCAGIYVLSFCQHRDIPTENIKLVQQTEWSPETRMIETIAIDIQLPPSFPAKYRDAVIRSAELCSVKKHMAQSPSFSISVTTVPDAS